MQHCDQEASSKYWWVFILLQKVFIDDRLAAVTAPGSRRAMLKVLSVHRIGRFKTRTPVSIPVNAHDGCSCLSYASKLRQPTLSTVTWTDKQSRSYDGNSSTSCLTDSISRWWSLLLESSRAEVGFVSLRFLWSPIESLRMRGRSLYFAHILFRTRFRMSLTRVGVVSRIWKWVSKI